jgi:hypothetical protein
VPDERPAWWQTIAPTVILLIAIVAGFWQLADPRADIKDIRLSYLSLREHEEFVRRFQSDIARIETEQRDQNHLMATKTEMTAQLHAAEQVTSMIQKRIDDLQHQVDLLVQRSLIQPPPNVSQPNAPRQP